MVRTTRGGESISLDIVWLRIMYRLVILSFLGNPFREALNVCTQVLVGGALLEGCPLAEHEVDGRLAVAVAGEFVLFLLTVYCQLCNLLLSFFAEYVADRI